MTDRPWSVLGAVALGNLVVAALHFGLAAAGPIVRDELDLGTAALGIVLASPAIGLMLGTYGWGLLADRTSERRVLAGAFVGFSVSTLAGAQAAAAGSTIAFTIAMLGSGLFGSAAHSAGGRAISAAFAPSRHGLVLSIRHVAIPVGAAIGGIVVPAVSLASGLATAVAGAAGLGACSAIALTVFVPSSRSARAREARRREPARGISPLRLPSMRMLALGAGSLAFVQLGIGSFLTVQLVDRAGVALSIAAAVFTASQLLGAVGRVVLGIVSDRVGNRVDVLVGVAVSVVVLVSASAVVGSTLGSVLLQALALVVVTSCNGVVVAVAASLAPAGRTGATLGMQTTANAFACSIAPIVLGAVLAAASWTAGTLVLVVVSGISFATLMRLRNTAARGA